jgi:small conductance mechanosensitive channel
MDIITVEIPIAAILVRLLAVVVTLIVGRWLARNSRKWLQMILEKQELPKSINTVLVNITYFTIWVITILTMLALLGVPIQALITGAALLIIVLAIALRESLGNFAATIIFVLFKPFQAGDLIETVDTLGVVQEIELFNTVMHSFDNKVHIFPNGLIQSNGITNLSKLGTIRVDLLFGISYKDDMQLAKQVLIDLLAEDERVQHDPPPAVFVATLGNSGVDIAAWPFVRPEDYLTFRFDIVEQGKLRLEEAGITIPFPQRDVHLYQETI